ncbi:MAG: hydrogenase formation protein HypD [Spirochaetales bacterium]|nr:hydrogenase formation protein HypD [Spirochaetales bacterium]
MERIKQIREALKGLGKQSATLMEVCGTHTMSIARNGIRSLLPEGVRLVSGPGCPVCVTSQGEIQTALDLAERENVLLCTFGDMMRVPGERGRLEDMDNVKIVYSPMEALTEAEKDRDRQVVFVGVGFETTSPLIAATVQEARRRKIRNFSVLPFHKTIPEALRLILSDPEVSIDGLILPGHVSVLTGRRYFDFITEYGTSGVVSGFEALDILEGIYLLLRGMEEGQREVLNNYTQVVKDEGNLQAMNTLYQVFESSDALWRGVGVIPESGLIFREQYRDFNALERFSTPVPDIPEPEGCLCGRILMGKSIPPECPWFGTECTPQRPIGPCMVSSEGTCAACYKYPEVVFKR